MAYPRLDVHLDTIRHNAGAVRSLCLQYGVSVLGVTKAFMGCPEIAAAYLGAGICALGDSRVENLKKLRALPAEKWLIRMPMRSEAEDTVRYADASLNSEWETILALDEAAGRIGTRHGILLMADLGDLREGYADYNALLRTADKISRLKNVSLRGIGTNLACFSFIRPDPEKMALLADLARRLPVEGAPVVSGGNSASLHLMMAGGFPPGINQLRLGESLLMGRERCEYAYLEGTRRDAFILRAEIIELQEKPSLPWGETGRDSYGHMPPQRPDRGIRKRAILALGKQDCDAETMRPVDAGIELLGASSDHMMLDVTDSGRGYRVGDAVAFELGYFSLMRAFTSPYVDKRYLA